MSHYTAEDLQKLEQRCMAKAQKLGLEVPDINFHLVQAEEMYDIAARGLPGRYSHWAFGRQYEQEKGDYDKGKGRIYELVINTRPVHAYLMDGNSMIAQLLVMAHVMGHATIYEHNRYFDVADKNILSRTRAAADRIDNYMGEYGRAKVEDFIDACEALQYNRSFDQLAKPYQIKAPEYEVKAFDVLFPEETSERRAQYNEEREEFRTRFPKQPVKDFLEFFERYSRHLEDWQRDVISIIRMEMDYFTPMMKTQVIHEAQAVYYHNTIVQELMAEDEQFSTDDFTEFQSMNARVLHPKIAKLNMFGQPIKDPEYEEPFIFCMGVNPYLTGYEGIYKEVKRICEAPTPEEKDRWPWAGEIAWDEKRIELAQVYDDAALLSEFINPAVCERAKLFIRPRTMDEYNHLRVLEDEAEEVRKQLVEQKASMGIPSVEIVNADFKRRGELYLVHHHNDGPGLDEEYAHGTLIHLANLWGHDVTVKTVERIPLDDTEPEFDPDDPFKPHEHLYTFKDRWYHIHPNPTHESVITTLDREP